MSYHTDFVQYSRTYGGFSGAAWMAYRVLNVFHNRAGTYEFFLTVAGCLFYEHSLA